METRTVLTRIYGHSLLKFHLKPPLYSITSLYHSFLNFHPVKRILFLSLKLFSWSEFYLPSQSCLLPPYITLPSDLQFTEYAVLCFASITLQHISVIIFASDIFLHGITSTCPLRLFSQLHSSAYESTEKLSWISFSP